MGTDRQKYVLKVYFKPNLPKGFDFRASSCLYFDRGLLETADNWEPRSIQFLVSQARGLLEYCGLSEYRGLLGNLPYYTIHTP